jgi:2-C-methyl-D-erythritol 4-phosphate cytidylyltransferase/2-C-methyl-D-erythritol 2,4-cyclodiphosphate synthase
VSSKIISEVAVASYKMGAALAAWPLPDTLKKGKGQLVERTIPRKDLWLAQTPQGFRFALAKKYLLHPSRTATDDVELAQRKGQKVALVLGSPINMKVTYPSDLSLCQKLI